MSHDRTLTFFLPAELSVIECGERPWLTYEFGKRPLLDNLPILRESEDE